LSGPLLLEQQFAEFGRRLPENCRRLGLNRRDLLFVEYVDLATQFIKTAAGKRRLRGVK